MVLGALSPRTRNAQVALYQAGDVEYLVATDAIGMGLNLDVDHVAFASDRKFDGYQFRKLNPAELAQIAGRAGRATRNGTFGTTGRCPPFEVDLAQALESHSFEPIKTMQWRNTTLDFSSIGALQASLAETPREMGLTRAPVAEDIWCSITLRGTRRSGAGDHADRRWSDLWEVCQVPDYRKISPATHAELATTLYGFLTPGGTIPTDWFARQVDEADRTEGDIDTLSNRIAHIRTWTFAANRPDWLADPEHWQGVTRVVEDKLSDALHERLTERFVDRRTSVLMRRLRENTALETDIGKDGEVVVEGHAIGRPRRAQVHAGSRRHRLGCAGAGRGRTEGPVGRDRHPRDATFARRRRATGALDRGRHPLARPARRQAGGRRGCAQAAGAHYRRRASHRGAARCGAGAARSGSSPTSSGARAVVQARRRRGYHGCRARRCLSAQRGARRARPSEGCRRDQGLDQPSRATLRKHGVRFGAHHIYVPALLKPAPRVLSTQLWALKHGGRTPRGWRRSSSSPAAAAPRRRRQ